MRKVIGQLSSPRVCLRDNKRKEKFKEKGPLTEHSLLYEIGGEGEKAKKKRLPWRKSSNQQRRKYSQIIENMYHLSLKES